MFKRQVEICEAEGGFIIRAWWDQEKFTRSHVRSRTIVAKSPAAAARHVSALLKEPAPASCETDDDFKIHPSGNGQDEAKDPSSAPVYGLSGSVG